MSDTRENLYEYEDVPYKDGVQKLFSFSSKGMGYITGAGSAEFLNEVKQKAITKRHISNINEINNIFDTTAQECKRLDPNWAEDIVQSYIAYSWYGEDYSGDNMFGINLVSESYIPYLGSNVRSINEGELKIIYPADLADKKNFTDVMQAKEQSFNVNEMPISKTIFEMLRMFREISSISTLSNSECQIGIQYLSNLSKTIHKAELSGDVKKLINIAQKNKILTKFKTVDEITL